MFSHSLSKTKYWILSTLGIVVILVIWQLVSSSAEVNPIFLPSPKKVLGTIGLLFRDGTLFADIGASLYRIVIGFLLSVVIALPLGIMIGVSKKAQAMLEPLVAFVRYIPPSAFIPLGILWLGVGETEKIFVIFIGIAPYLALLVSDAVMATRKEMIEAALTLGATRWTLITKVILPYSMPVIWDAMRIMIGAAWTFVIIAEIVGATSGLGHLMVESQRFLRTDTIFASIVVIGFLGLLTDAFFRFTYRVFFPWTHMTGHNEVLN